MTLTLSGSSEIYATPRHVESVGDCFFYHTTELPGLPTVEGEWDLRPGIDAYFGGASFAGKRVLDVGAANGFLSFHMEKAGAEVVSYDLSEEHSWDIVPYSGIDLAALDVQRRQHLRAINNGYWLAHRSHASRARMVHGTVYTIPEAIGPVDIAVFGAILLHLRDPFRALHNGLRLAGETAIVTELLPRRYSYLRRLGPALIKRLGLPMMLLPRQAQMSPVDGWWILPPAIVQEYLRILGFGDSTVSYHDQIFRGEKRLVYTVVARRTGPTTPLTY